MAIDLVAPAFGDNPSISLRSNGSTITLGQQNCAVDDLFIVFGGNKGSSTSTSIAVVDPGVGTPSTPTEWDLPSFPYNYGTASGASQSRVAVAWWFRITAADIDTAAGDLVEVEISPPAQNCQYCINVWRGVGTTDFDGAPASNTMVGLQIQTDNASQGRTFLWVDSSSVPTTTGEPWSDTFFDSSMTVIAMAINDRSNWNAPSTGSFPTGWNTCIYGNGGTLLSNEISSNGQSSVMLYSQYANFADADATSDPGMATPLDMADTSGNTSGTRQLTLWMAFKEDGATANARSFTDAGSSADILQSAETTANARSFTDAGSSADILQSAEVNANTRSFTDSVSGSDLLQAQESNYNARAFIDSASSADILQSAEVNTNARSFTDSVSGSDLLQSDESNANSRSITDAVSSADILQAVEVRAIVRTFTDSVSVSDILQADEVNANLRSFTDSVTGSDLLQATEANVNARTFTDSASVADIFQAEEVNANARAFIDSVFSADILQSEEVNANARTFTDSAFVADIFQAEEVNENTRSFTDAVAIADILQSSESNVNTRTFTDAISGADTLAKGIARNLSDACSSSDIVQKTKGLGLSFTDSGSSADVIDFTILRSVIFVDSASTADTKTQSTTKTIADSASASDIVTTTGPVITEISVTIPGIGSVSAELLTEEEALAVIDIWNTALTTLGITAVTSTTDSSPQQLLLTNVYPLFKRQFLADHLWNGAKKTKALTALKDNAGDAVTPPSRWTYAFDLPDDVLRVWRLNGLENQPDYVGGFSSNMWEIEVIVTDEGEAGIEALTRSLCTDESTATIEYVFDVGDDNIGLLGPLTQHALGRALAVYVAQNFGKNTTEIAQLEALAKEALLAAKGVDGQEGSPQIFSPTSLLGVRYI